MIVYSSLPWNQKTLLGYFFATCYIAICLQSSLIVNGAILLLFISICIYHHAFYNIFNETTIKLNICKKDQEVKQIFDDLIHFRILVQE